MKNILLIEDEIDLQSTIETYLEDTWNVFLASTLREGQEKLRTEKIDLVVLDVNLPDGNGFEFCKTIKRNHSPQNPPIIFLTGNNDIDDRVNGLTIGGDDYLTKPFHLAELKVRIENQLRKQADTLTSPTVHAGDLILDMNHQKVMLKTNDSATPVKLTSLEFRILSVLTQTPGQILSRDQIIEFVWGNDAKITSRVIDTHVSNLRKKISLSRFTIDSVHGRGYQFAARSQLGY